MRSAIVLADVGRDDWILCQIISMPYEDSPHCSLQTMIWYTPSTEDNENRAVEKVGGQMYDIELTPQAIEDLQWFRKHEQQEIVDNINQQLRYEPLKRTRNRKPMEPNATAEWELRIRHFRVLYTVDSVVRIVEIQRVGEKRRNFFFFRGRQEDL